MTNEQRKFIQASEAAIHAHIRIFENPTYSESDKTEQFQTELQTQETHFDSSRTVFEFSKQGIDAQIIEM